VRPATGRGDRGVDGRRRPEPPGRAVPRHGGGARSAAGGRTGRRGWGGVVRGRGRIRRNDLPRGAGGRVRPRGCSLPARARGIVDSHFSGRGRHRRLARAVLQRPGHIGVGVDEWTALLVQGERIGVIGREGRAAYYHFADAAAGQVRRYRLGAGEAVNVGAPV